MNWFKSIIKEALVELNEERKTKSFWIACFVAITTTIVTVNLFDINNLFVAFIIFAIVDKSIKYLIIALSRLHKIK